MSAVGQLHDQHTRYVCLVKTKIKCRRVEEEEIQRETGRKIWVVAQRKAGCRA